MKRVFLLWVSLLPKLSLQHKYQIWQWAQKHECYEQTVTFLQQVNLPPMHAQMIRKWVGSAAEKTALQKLMTYHFLTIVDANYPQLLKAIAQPPLVLFYQGNINLLQTRCLGIVGSRQIVADTQQILINWLPDFVQQDWTIVSGNAKGVDTLAHRIVLGHQGKTIAVIGTGIDVAYPVENRAVQLKIAQSGLVLSEYLPWEGPQKWHFPERNRIIVGLVEHVLICQAKLKSGSMVTAEIAIDENRTIWTIPASVLNPVFAGNLALLQDGAQCLLQSDDLNKMYF